MKIRKKCAFCKKGKHSQCTGESANGEGRECPCCGLLTIADRVEKEKTEKLEKDAIKLERVCRENASAFDALINRKKIVLEVTDPIKFLDCLPKTEVGIKAWAKEASMTIKWFEFFLNEYREDYMVYTQK